MKTRKTAVLGFPLLCALGILSALTCSVDSVRAADVSPASSAAIPAEARAHTMRPLHIANVTIDEGRIDRAPSLVVPRIVAVKPAAPKLDIKAFGEDFHKSLKDSVTGYAMQLRQNGTPVYTLIWNWARTPTDGGQGWKLDTRMHIASVSKLMTGIAMTKLLDAKGISYDAKIADYLPTYWKRGSNIDKITFRHLMNHTSGFATGTSSSDYEFMKTRVAMGVPAVGGYDYENMNFGLCRILIAVINGSIGKAQTFPFANDQLWDFYSIAAFRKYMQDNVFTPSGVSNVGFDSGPKAANAYAFPNGGAAGWDSGNLASVSGGAGFRMSVNEVLDVLGTFRRKGTIMSPGKAQQTLDNAFGIDQIIDTPAGKLYNKNGSWGQGGKTEQCVAYVLPNNMELVAFVNSPIGLNSASLRGTVKTLYGNHLE